MVELVANLMEGSSHGNVVLTSKTESQQKLLTAAGLAFRMVPPEVDEAAIHEALYSGNAETDPSDVADLRQLHALAAGGHRLLEAVRHEC